MVNSKLSPEEKLAWKRQKARERFRKYSERNKEKIQLRNKLHYLRHKDEVSAYKRRYYIEHKSHRDIIVTCKKGSKSKCSKKSASENLDFQNMTLIVCEHRQSLLLNSVVLQKKETCWSGC